MLCYPVSNQSHIQQLTQDESYAWVEKVHAANMTICVHEKILFSGHHDVKINYMGIANHREIYGYEQMLYMFQSWSLDFHLSIWRSKLIVASSINTIVSTDIELAEIIYGLSWKK